MRSNTKTPSVTTHEGAVAKRITPIQALRRAVMANLLFEDQFYESGVTIAHRIDELARQVSPQELAALAVQARTEYNLRHVSLLLAVQLVRRGASAADLVARTVEGVVQRADELAELVALYWKDGRVPLSKQLKVGLGRSFNKFSEYQFAKYDRDNAIKLRDVLRLCHAKPKDETQSKIFKKILERTLTTPDTWEVELSAGKSKKDTFERLIKENKLGYLALLRNLRNMYEANCDRELVVQAILDRKGGADKVLPFRYIAAARAAPAYAPAIDTSLLKTIDGMPQLTGTTVFLVDVSGSMDMHKVSAKSELTRTDAAATLACMLPGDVRVFTFSEKVVEVPAYRGSAGVREIINSQPHRGTYLGRAVQHINENVKCDRLIVISDEQSSDRVPDPIQKFAYMINVASYKNGVGYGKWTHLDGFSERVLEWIGAYESLN